MKTLTVKTERRTQLVDVTAQVEKAVSAAKVSRGICYLYVPHTTAGIAINECADPEVARDIEGALDRREVLLRRRWNWQFVVGLLSQRAAGYRRRHKGGDCQPADQSLELTENGISPSVTLTSVRVLTCQSSLY